VNGAHETTNPNQQLQQIMNATLTQNATRPGGSAAMPTKPQDGGSAQQNQEFDLHGKSQFLGINFSNHSQPDRGAANPGSISMWFD